MITEGMDVWECIRDLNARVIELEELLKAERPEFVEGQRFEQIEPGTSCNYWNDK